MIIAIGYLGMINLSHITETLIKHQSGRLTKCIAKGL